MTSDAAASKQSINLQMAHAIRFLAADAVQAAKSGHPGMPMGMADVATVLFTKFLKFDAAQPSWPDRDRFILSAGHGSMLLYSLLHLTGRIQPTGLLSSQLLLLHPLIRSFGPNPTSGWASRWVSRGTRSEFPRPST